jgi:hypothetical protein
LYADKNQRIFDGPEYPAGCGLSPNEKEATSNVMAPDVCKAPEKGFLYCLLAISV